MDNTQAFEFLTASFILANIISELLKYCTTKIVTYLDSKIKSPLDVNQ